MVRTILAIALLASAAPALVPVEALRPQPPAKPVKPPQRAPVPPKPVIKPPTAKHYFYHKPDCSCRCGHYDRNEDDDDDRYDSEEDYD